MRITFVGPVPPMSGGISHHSSKLVQALRAIGHRVDVVSWRSQYPSLLYRGKQKDENATPMSGAQFYLRWWDVFSWWRARRAASDGDLLVFPYVTPFLAVPHWFISTGSDSVVAIVHNAKPHERMPLERGLSRLAFRNVSGAVVHGHGVVEDLRELGVDCEVHVLPMPPLIELSRFEMPELPPPVRLLFFGYVRPYKGLEMAISSVAVLKELGVQAILTVAGEFWEPVQKYSDQITDLGLDGSVDLRPGYATDTELEMLLGSHHVVVAPYVEDSTSGVVPLALSAGRPVVSTTVKGVSEQVTHGSNGVLVPPGDPLALAKGIQEVADDLNRFSESAAGSSSDWLGVAEVIAASISPGTQ